MLFRSTCYAEPGIYDIVIVAQSLVFNKAYRFPVKVILSDCYGAGILETAINGLEYRGGAVACIEETAAIEATVKNTKEKPITLNISVEGAKATVEPQTMVLDSNETGKVKIGVSFAGQNTGKKQFNLLLKSEQFEEKQVFALDVQDCYNLAVDYGELARQFDVNAEEERVFTISLKNIGTRAQEVKGSVEGLNWAFFQPETRKVEAGKQEGFFLYISPTFDTREGKHTAKITITARDFSDTREISMNVYGGLYALVGEARLGTSSTLNNVVETAEKTVELKVVLKNDGNSILRLTGVKAIGYNAAIPFKEATLAPEETTELKMTLYLGKNFDKQQFVVPLRVSTDKGNIVKSIPVDLSKPAAPTGLLGLASAKDALIILLALIVVALIAMIAMRAGGREQETGPAEIAREVEQQPEKKLAQKGKRKTAKKRK